MNQSTERFLKVEAVFNEALALPQEARAALVEILSNGDGALAAEVGSLLEACEAEERLTALLWLGADANQGHLISVSWSGPPSEVNFGPPWE